MSDPEVPGGDERGANAAGRRAGVFIVFEGGEGAGKSTQVAALAEALRGRGEEVVTTREPGGTEGAEAIRALLVEGKADRWSGIAEALLNYAARADHLDRLIRPALARGAWVICDRFADSTDAYQGAGRGVETAFLDALRERVVADSEPDLTILLDIPPEEGLDRAQARRSGETRYEEMDLDFHEKLRSRFQRLAYTKEEAYAVIDARAEAEAVTEAVWETVAQRFAGRLETGRA